MGSSSSKFRNHLQNGDEYAALQVFQSSSELRKSLDPNSSYGDTLHHTPLHLAAKHAMKPLLKIFLNESGGNPNKRNSDNATSLHLACQGQIARSPSTRERRTACVALILQWRGPQLESGDNELVQLSTTDSLGNTALHYASSTGLTRCVELLVRSSAPLFLENNNQETACDLAEKNGHQDIAQFLESNMVFCPETSSDIKEPDSLIMDDLTENIGLRPQDLLEAKDHLLVETSDMLHVPLFTAEALLRSHEWSRESLLEAWMRNPVQCCQQARIQPPSSALYFSYEDANALQLSCTRLQMEYQSESLNSPSRLPPSIKADILCEICVRVIMHDEEQVIVPCGHRFCHSCWESYLSVKIQDGEAHTILCPDFNCDQLVPIDIIEKLVSPCMVRRYLQFDIDAFVESNPRMKWCPFPGCSRAVRLPESEMSSQDNLQNIIQTETVSHAVDCGNGHYFCWECLGEAHAPCGCARWKEWQMKIAEIKPEDLQSTCNKTEDAANCLWLVTNSKQCPNCKSPIQKNEGCNHMKCSKCKHDFCWVCLEGWKKHGSSTGGYFRCNRYEAVQRVEEKAGELLTEASMRNREMQEIKRFVHYYTRFKNHENSYKLEEPLISIAKLKMDGLASSLNEMSLTTFETHFLEEAVNELLRARRVLCGSYVYGYFLEDNGYNKTIFEFMQNDLEDATECLSEMVARHYLRSPRSKIMQSAFLVRRKRQEFVTSVSKGLIPPETPPSLRKNRRRKYPGVLGMDPLEDEQLSRAIMASLQDIDPNNPWVKDEQGKHANLPAIFDWPDYDSDDATPDHATNKTLNNILGACTFNGCTRPRARNPRTMAIHEYCSLRCSQKDKLGETMVIEKEPFEVDYSMDMLIALEMSRLQMIEDIQRIEKNKCQRSQEEMGATASVATFEEETEQEIEFSEACAKDANNPSYTSNTSTNENYELNLPGVSNVSCNFSSSLAINNKTKIERRTFNFEEEQDCKEEFAISGGDVAASSSQTASTSDISFYFKTNDISKEVISDSSNINIEQNDKTLKSLFTTGEDRGDSF